MAELNLTLCLSNFYSVLTAFLGSRLFTVKNKEQIALPNPHTSCYYRQ